MDLANLCVDWFCGGDSCVDEGCVLRSASGDNCRARAPGGERADVVLRADARAELLRGRGGGAARDVRGVALTPRGLRVDGDGRG
jgi:hypothetical protein